MQKQIRIFAQIVLIVSITWMGYFLQRESFTLLTILFTLAFTSFIYLYRSITSLTAMLRLSYILRFMLLFAIPALSNDFYRFIWDGRMSLLGLNPYLILPNEFAGSSNMGLLGNDASVLYDGQGDLSPGNYTCYPPLNQLMFILPAYLFPQNIFMSVVVMRLILIVADIGTIHYGRKILIKLGLPESNILLYALNPFIILEITGNLHFEGAMILFLIISIYFLLHNKRIHSMIFLTLSVSVKLIPLLFIPLFLKRLGQKGLVFYLIGVLAGTALLFLPFLSSGLVSNFMSSIDLYFRKFEFNASIYYLVRWGGFQVFGWNIIQKAGPFLALIILIFVLHLAILPDNRNPRVLIHSMLFATTFYYFMATTVHPWYISLPLILSVFTKFRFPVIWTFTAILSYSAYSNAGFEENLWLITAEYLVVIVYMGVEIFGRPKLVR